MVKKLVIGFLLLIPYGVWAGSEPNLAYIIDLQTRSLLGDGAYELYIDKLSLKQLPLEVFVKHEDNSKELSYVVEGRIKLVPLLSFDDLVDQTTQILSRFLEVDTIPVPEQMLKHKAVAADTQQMMLKNLAGLFVKQTFGKDLEIGKPVVRSNIKIPVYKNKENGMDYLLILEKRMYL